MCDSKIRSHAAFFFDIRFSKVEEKAQHEGGGYQCTGNGQDSGITRKWIGSFIIFALVAMFFMSPLKIFITKVLLPNYTLSEAEEDGLKFDGDHALLDTTALASKKRAKKVVV